MMALAGPVVLAELGWIAMGVVDTVMVGRVSAEAIGAVSIGNILFHALGIFGTGLLLGLDAMIPRAFGAGDIEDCHRSLLQAVYLSLACGLVLMLALALFIPFLRTWGLHPDVLASAVPYIRAVLWSAVPLLLFASFRHYLQGMNVVRPIMVVLVSANLVNVFANWALIFGHLGFPAFGAEGAGWASCVSRLYMALSLFGYILYHDQRYGTGLWRIPPAPDATRISRLVRIGLPAAAQRALELGAFAVVTVLAGKLAPAELAAHQIALNVASVTFMVPLGISAAAAVRVGQALGRRDPAAARRSGWTALLLSALFMGAAGVAFLLAPRLILRAFTTDATVIEVGAGLLIIAAFFQLFDGIQVVATGALRGAGDTHLPMISNLVGHWFLGLPVGYLLCFHAGWGVSGLWVGVSVGLIAVGALLLWVWAQRTHWRLAEERLAA